MKRTLAFFLIVVLWAALCPPIKAQDTTGLFPDFPIERLNDPKYPDERVLPFVFKGYVYAFSLPQKVPLWRMFIGGDLTNPFIVKGGTIYLYDVYNRVYAIDMVKGAVLWRTGVRQVIRGKPCINGRTLTVGAQQGTIYVLDSESGRITDEYRGEGEINSGLNLYRDLMIVAYKNGRVVAYNADTMKPRWRFSCKGIISTRPVIRDGYIFFGAWDDTFYVLRAEDGDLLWESYVGENVSRDFLVFDREIILFFPKGEILSLGRSDGRIDWVKYYGSTEFNFNYFQGIDKFFIFVPELIALDPDDGTVAFNYRERAFFFYKEMLFENMIEGKVRLNDEDRSRLLSEVYFTISSYPLLPPQTAGEEIVYFVADDSFFYVYNLEKDFFIVKYKLV